MIKACVCTIENFLACLLASSHSTEKYSCIGNDKPARLYPKLQFFIVSVSNRFNLIVDIWNIHELLFISILNSYASSDINIFEVREKLRFWKDKFGGFDKHIFVLLFQIRANMLMQTNYFYTKFLCCFNCLL